MRGLFSGLNPGNPRGRKDVALRDLIFRNEIERFALELDFALSDRSARAQRFGRNINHLCAAVDANMRQALHRSAADRDHFAVRLVIIAKVVLLRLSIDNVEEKLLELVITRAAAKWFHNIKFEIAAEARTQFPVARETKFVTALAK